MNGNQKILVVLVVLSSIIPMWFIWNNVSPIPSNDVVSGDIKETNTFFRFEGEPYIITAYIPQDRFDAYDDSWIIRYLSHINNSYRYITPDDPVIQDIAKQIENKTLGWSDVDRANFTLAYTQALPYKSDNSLYGTRDYWAFPIETLYHNGGDCKNKSILYVSIMRSMGYDAILVGNRSHAVSGVNIDGLTGQNITHFGKTYYLADSTTKTQIGVLDGDGYVPAIWFNMIGLAFIIVWLVILIISIKGYKEYGNIEENNDEE